MFKFFTLTDKRLKIGHFGVCCLGTLVMGAAKAQISRQPASYTPDDDVIVKPVDNEVSLYSQIVTEDKSEDVALSRNQLKIWSDNQIYADQYGIDNSAYGSTFYVPTQAEKLDYFKSRYMRYLQGRSQQPLQEMSNQWYSQFRASNEVDRIDELEAKFKSSTKTSAITHKQLPSALQAKEVSLFKDVKFIFQPRVEQGMAIMGFRTSNIYARAWLGINGKAEFNVQQNYESIGLRIMGNYYAEKGGRYLASIDKRIYKDIWARATSSKTPKHPVNMPLFDNAVMLLYAKQF